MERFKTVIVISILFTLILASCKKTWTCDVIHSEYLCIKGSDSVYVNTSLALLNGRGMYEYSQSYSDSLLRYYRLNGYEIDTSYFYVFMETVYSSETLKAYEENGITCK